jgi:glycosyltransferase involved in cell wall biosynthesis
MRVLHVIPSLAARTGGTAVAVVELARAASKRGVDAVIFATDLGVPASAGKGTRVASGGLIEGADDLRPRIFPVRRPYRLARSPELCRALRAEVGSFDVVHVHALYLDPLRVAAKEARRRRVPYVVSPHGTFDPWLRNRRRVRKAFADLLWQRRMLRRAAALHFTSEEEARLAGAAAPGVPRVVVPLGIHWDQFQHLPAPAVFGSGGPVVLSLGRVAAKKGLDVLITAFALIRDRFPRAELVIAGPDDEGLVPQLSELAQREGVAGRVHFPGMLVGRDKLAALAAADVWALSSYTENFGIAVVEALAAGLPTVISPAVNLAADIERAGAGVVAVAKPQPFAGALIHLLEDEPRRLAYAERGRAFARGYDWDAVGDGIVELYERVIREP